MPNRPTAGRLEAVPESDPQFAHLSLDGLRTYRTALTTEEDRVSYWRRIIQARLDLVRAADEDGVPPTLDDLGGLFAEHRFVGGRHALMRILPVDDMPPLPDLAAVWGREPVPGDRQHNAGLVHELVKAEAQLSAYRGALHRRLSAATCELIARYREQPDLCLSALPRPPGPRQAVSF